MSSESLSELGKLSEPITKLIDSITGAVSVLYEPTRIRKKAKAEGEAIKTIAKAKVDALVISDKNIRQYYLELEEEKLLREHRKKTNRDLIAGQAAMELMGKQVDDNPVDKDWVIQFFESAEDVSSEEMQVIWARLLAGEVKRPGTFSKRAIHALKLMSTREAQALKALVEYSIKNEMGEFLLPTSYMGEYFRERFGDYAYRKQGAYLDHLNLITVYNFPATMVFPINNGEFSFSLLDRNVKVSLGKPVGDFKMRTQGQKFTSFGKELALLVTGDYDEGYLTALCKRIEGQLKERGFPSPIIEISPEPTV